MQQASSPRLYTPEEIIQRMSANYPTPAHSDLADGREGENARSAHPRERTRDSLIDHPRPAPPSCYHLPLLPHRYCHTTLATWTHLGRLHADDATFQLHRHCYHAVMLILPRRRHRAADATLLPLPHCRCGHTAAADASSARSAFVIARATHTSARRPALRRTDSPRIPPTTFPLVSGRSTWRGRSFPPISRPISAPFPPPCASRSSRPSSRCSRDCPAVTSSCNAPRLLFLFRMNVSRCYGLVAVLYGGSSRAAPAQPCKPGKNWVCWKWSRRRVEGIRTRPYS